ncbi:hypothetical protein D3C75_1117170 [compost metagenome]
MVSLVEFDLHPQLAGQLYNGFRFQIAAKIGRHGTWKNRCYLNRFLGKLMCQGLSDRIHHMFGGAVEIPSGFVGIA